MASDSKGKKVIKGIAKTTGKYALKGIGKGVELAGRGAAKTVEALVKHPELQKIATCAGMLAVGTMIPAVGATMVGIVGFKYLLDRSIIGNNKGIMNEIGDLINAGNIVTKDCCKVIAPVLNKSEKGMKNLGQKYQAKIDDMFR